MRNIVRRKEIVDRDLHMSAKKKTVASLSINRRRRENKLNGGDFDLLMVAIVSMEYLLTFVDVYFLLLLHHPKVIMNVLSMLADVYNRSNYMGKKIDSSMKENVALLMEDVDIFLDVINSCMCNNADKNVNTSV